MRKSSYKPDKLVNSFLKLTLLTEKSITKVSRSNLTIDKSSAKL